MKTTSIFCSLAAAALLFASCNSRELDQVQKERDSLQAVVSSQDEEMSSLFETLNQIEENLSQVSAKYSQVQDLKKSSLEGNSNIKSQITSQVAGIEEMLQANKEKLAQLNAKLGTLGKKNAELQEFVTKLEERVASQEAQISSLTAELETSKVTIANLNKNVTDLTQNVNDLTSSNRQKDETIAHQTAEANKAYFLVGSLSELKEKGIVNMTGGFIGLGKKQSINAEMTTEYFTTIDRTKTNIVPIHQKKPQVVSKHPANSYEIVMDDTDKSVAAYLRITDPAQFWKYTKYLVITTR